MAVYNLGLLNSLVTGLLNSLVTGFSGGVLIGLNFVNMSFDLRNST